MALPPSDPDPRTTVLSGGVVSYTDEGPSDAPPLLAVHGIPGSVRDFRHLAPHLIPSVRVIRVDLPGFGGSTVQEPAIASLAARARVLLELADALGLSRFAVLGHSMGGGAAAVLASEQPQRVALLVLVASLGLSRHRALGAPPAVLRLLARGLGLPLLPRLVVPRLRRQYRRRRFAGAEGMGAADFALHLRAAGASDFALMRRTAAAPLPRTLLAYARDDAMVETWVAEELAAALPAARVLAFDEGGHNLQKTRAAELAAAILEELAGASR